MGKQPNPDSLKWLKITGITLAVLALGGVIAGLVIELS